MTKALKQKIQQAMAYAETCAAQIGKPIQWNRATETIWIELCQADFSMPWNANRFGFIGDMGEGKIDFFPSVQQVMGWSRNMSLKSFFEKIHPDYFRSFWLWIQAAFKVFSKLFSDRVERLVFQFELPLKHRNGAYYWCLITNMPLAVDADGSVAVHLTLFQRLDLFHAYNARLFEPFLMSGHEIKEDINTMIWEIIKPDALKGMHNKHIDAMKLMNQKMSSREIAEKFTNIHTVHAYKKQILAQGRSICGPVFKDAAEVAVYYERMGWIKKN